MKDFNHNSIDDECHNRLRENFLSKYSINLDSKYVHHLMLDNLKGLYKSEYNQLSVNDLLSPLMIDRLHFVIHIGEHSPISETILLEITSEEGEILKTSNKSKKLKASEEVKETSLLIRSISDNKALEVITTPNKYIFGHNLYGSSDIMFLITTCLFKALNEESRPDLLDKTKDAEIELRAVDINSMLSHEMVNQYIQTLESRLSTNLTLDKRINTLYVGSHKHSDYAYRIYDKFTERKDKKLLAELTADQIQYLEDKVRVELILTHRELQKLDLTNPTVWTEETASDTYFNYLEKLKIMITRNEDLSKLDPTEKGYYCTWRYLGESTDAIFPNKNTATKYRKILKEKLGIDIYRPYAEDNAPLEKIKPPIELERNGIPSTEAPMVMVYKIRRKLIDRPEMLSFLMENLQQKNHFLNCNIKTETLDITTTDSYEVEEG